MPTLNQTPEQIARDNIDRQLHQAGWCVQNKDKIDWSAGPLAVRHYLTQDGKEADYVLFLKRGQPVGIVEAKKEDEGYHLTVVEEQSTDYATSKLKYLDNDPLPFVYESTGAVTRFTDYRDPKPRSRPVFTFTGPKPLLNGSSRPNHCAGDCRICPTCPPRVCAAARLRPSPNWSNHSRITGPAP
jgi:type I restriction enzyme R subunit